MSAMSEPISIALETSCRAGGVALGRGDQWLASIPLGASGRHAAELPGAFETLLAAQNLGASDVNELYVSVGPGSFTGLRVALSLVRTWGQVQPSLRIVAVATPLAVAENMADQPWTHLGVLLAAKDRDVHATLLERTETGAIEMSGPPVLGDPAELLSGWPRSLWISGEGLSYCPFDWPREVQLVDESLRMPRVESVWRVGRRMARRGEFTPFNRVQCAYARRPEALRLWEKRHGKD